MKITVCDVCWPKETRQSVSHWNLKRGVERYKLDVCDEHKNFLNKSMSMSEAIEKVREVLGISDFKRVA